MSKTFQTRIKHKRDSQANWETNNPLLLEGELGIVVMPDGKIKTKIGDGVTNYNLLPFSSSDVELTWENIEDKPFSVEKTTYGSVISNGDTIYWDGDTTGLIKHSESWMFLLTEKLPAPNQLDLTEGKAIFDAWFGGSEENLVECTISDYGSIIEESAKNNGDYEILDLIPKGVVYVLVPTDPSAMLSSTFIVLEDVNFPTSATSSIFFSKGIWMPPGIKSITIPGWNFDGLIKKIDSKFLPDNLTYLSDDAAEIEAQAKIKTLTDDSGAIIYPKTKAEAVFGLENIENRIDSKVPTYRTINGKSLNENILLTAADVGATSFKPTSVSIATDAWDSNVATVTCEGITPTNTIIVAPAPVSFGVWGNSKIRATAQGDGSITFTCDSTPTEIVSVNIVILG